jgi:hypothetical protein
MRYRLITAQNYGDQHYPTFAEEEEFVRGSYVAIGTSLGKFSDTAWCHPQDEFSSFFGCQIAENRAIIKYHKKKIAQIKIELKTLKNLKLLFESMKDFTPKSREYCQLCKQVHIKENELKKEQALVIAIKETIDKSIKERDEYMKKLAAKKKDNSN